MHQISQQLTRLTFRSRLLLAAAACVWGCSSAEAEDALALQAGPSVASAPPPLHPSWFLSGGSGCPGSASTILAYSKGFDVVFEQFRSVGTSSQACTVMMRAPAVPGWEYTIHSLALSVRGLLKDGDSLTLVTDPRFADAPSARHLSSYTEEDASPKGMEITFHRAFQEVFGYKKTWSGCGRARNWVVQLENSIQGSQDAYATISRMSVEFEWRRCQQ